MASRLAHLSNAKHSSLDHRRHHEREYRTFLRALPSARQHRATVPEQRSWRHRPLICHNDDYLFQRQMCVQYRENRRRLEYERIQKENLRFSQKLIEAKPSLDRADHELFFLKHCKLKQRLQRHSEPISVQRKMRVLSMEPSSDYLIEHIESLPLASRDTCSKTKKLNGAVRLDKDSSCKVLPPINRIPPLSTT